MDTANFRWVAVDRLLSKMAKCHVDWDVGATATRAIMIECGCGQPSWWLLYGEVRSEVVDRYIP